MSIKTITAWGLVALIGAINVAPSNADCLVDGCSDYGRACQKNRNDAYVCWRCHNVNRACCDDGTVSDPGTYYCTNFYECDTGKLTCIPPTAKDCPLSASSSDNPSLQQKHIVELGTNSGYVSVNAEINGIANVVFAHGSNEFLTIDMSKSDDFINIGMTVPILEDDGTQVTVTVEAGESATWDVEVDCATAGP